MFGLKTLEQKLKTLVLVGVAGGLGVGGYTYRDHPLVRQLLGKADQVAGQNGVDLTQVEAEAKDVVKKVVGEVARTVEEADPSRPGAFEVAIAAVRIDPAEFHAGRAADLDVRVIRHAPKGGDDAVLWEGRATARPDPESHGRLELSWADRPFRVDWKPGQEFTIEVRDRKLLGLIEATWFKLDLDDDAAFPLRSKTYALDARADGRPTRDPSANAIVLKSHRIEPASSVAEGESPRRSTRR